MSCYIYVWVILTNEYFLQFRHTFHATLTPLTLQTKLLTRLNTNFLGTLIKYEFHILFY